MWFLWIMVRRVDCNIFNNTSVIFDETNAISRVKIMMLIAWSVASMCVSARLNTSPQIKAMLHVSDHHDLTNSGWHTNEIISANNDYLLCGGMTCLLLCCLITHTVCKMACSLCVWLTDGLMIVQAMSHRGNWSYDCPSQWMNLWMKYWTTEYMCSRVCYEVF